MEQSQPAARGQSLLEWYEALISAALVLVLVFSFFFRIIQVDGESMVPTLENGDKLIVWGAGYEPQRGDVVIVDSYTSYGRPLVKRVIAKGGDTISIDYALKLATQPNVILASFGDMMRVPGSKEDLLSVKARGADIRMLYTPLDALSLAEENPDKEIVFFAIGFETTAPVHLMALKEAIRRGLPNFSILTSLFTVPPAIEAILSDPESKVDGFLTAGHVCAITGNRAYHRLTARYKIPMVVTGFEPVDLLYGIYRCISQLEAGSYEVENAYKRAVPEQGNAAARQLMDEMLEPCDQDWRGIGIIPSSGLQLRSEYKRYSSRMRFQLRPEENRIASECIAGLIMRGLRQPSDCPHFGKACHPTHPLGAPMVSSEGVCAAYYRYK